MKEGRLKSRPFYFRVARASRRLSGGRPARRFESANMPARCRRYNLGCSLASRTCKQLRHGPIKRRDIRRLPRCRVPIKPVFGLMAWRCPRLPLREDYWFTSCIMCSG